MAEIKRAAMADVPMAFDSFITKTPVFEAAQAIIWTRDDLHDVIEALRAIKRYDLSDRLRTLQQRLDDSAASLTAVTLEPRAALRQAALKKQTEGHGQS